MEKRFNLNKFGGCVVVDGLDNDFIYPNEEVKELLNRQTASNSKLIEQHDWCGCFHCGSTFSTSEVEDQ